ncbi:MAG: hypothetical protein ACOC1F_14745, partial [Myxococcota bacterium]
VRNSTKHGQHTTTGGEPCRRAFLSLSGIRRELQGQVDPFAPLDQRMKRFHELDRWRGQDRVDLDPYGRLLSSYRDEARRKLRHAPGEVASFVEVATRLSELLLRLAGECDGPCTQRSERVLDRELDRELDRVG